MPENVNLFLVEKQNSENKYYYCTGGVHFPELLEPAVIYKSEFEETKSIFGEVPDVCIDFDTNQKTYEFSFNGKFNDLKESLKDVLYFRGKYEDSRNISDKFKNKFGLMIPKEAKSFIWAYQFESKSNLKKLSEMYDKTNFEENSPKGQLTRFALFGAFIFFSEVTRVRNEFICGISTLNFPEKYPEEPFDGLVLNTPISYIDDDSTIETFDVTIPSLKINKAKKYKVDLSKANDNNGSCFEFIYEMNRKEFNNFVKFEAMEVIELIGITKEKLKKENMQSIIEKISCLDSGSILKY